MSQAAILGAIAILVCCSSSSAMLMMGGGGDSTPSGSSSGPAEVTFSVPTDEDSKAECYMSRYVDLRAAFGKNKESAKGHYNQYTTNGTENRNNSCTMSDAEAQCYLDRYSDVKAYAGTDLKKARKHYYETGIKENRDFACPPAVKELICYVQRYPDLQTAFGTDYEIGMDWNNTLYKANGHWHSNGKSEGRDYSCP